MALTEDMTKEDKYFSQNIYCHLQPNIVSYNHPKRTSYSFIFYLLPFLHVLG